MIGVGGGLQEQEPELDLKTLTNGPICLQTQISVNIQHGV